jgi:hypothetical protein
MTPMTPPDPTHPESAPGHAGLAAGQTAGPDAADLHLHRALKALPADVSEEDLDALASTVLRQWRERQVQGTATVATGGGAAAVLAPRSRRRRWWLGTASLALAAVAATTFYVTRTDPALEELMQPDVLSQMAIGEM